MVNVNVTPEEMEQLKQVAKAYHEAGAKAATEKLKELKMKVEKPAGEPIGGCVPCAVCIPDAPPFAVSLAFFIP